MILTSLFLKNFRIHSELNINFGSSLNYIIGGNGVGKTSVLESIYYLCTTKSCITRSDNDVLKFNENSFLAEGEFSDLTKNTVKVLFSGADNKKQFYVDNKLIGRASSVIGRFPLVTLLPSDHSITQGSPGERRRFFDLILSQANPNYLETLIEYNRILKQRGALLYTIRESMGRSFDEELSAWSAKLVEKGTELIKYRVNFIEKFSLYMNESFEKIMGEEESPEIKYLFFEGEQTENIEEGFYKILNSKKNDEIRRATNLVGPHRDDFEFTINNINLRLFGSQGQHKTFQAVLRFAEFFYLKDVTSKTPVFLLDDVFGELDSKRAFKISEYLSHVGQAIITLTDFGNFSFLKSGDNDKIINLTEKSEVYA